MKIRFHNLKCTEKAFSGVSVSGEKDTENLGYFK